MIRNRAGSAKIVGERIKKRRMSSGTIVEQTIPDSIRRGTKIFVVGPPRSGTTLVYSMIANELFLPECTFISTLMKVFDEIYKFSDDERFDYYGHNLSNLAEIFKKPIYDFLYTAASKVGMISANRFIYKDPMLTLYLNYFHLFFTHAYKIVFCIRDPRDVVASMFKVLKKQDSKMDDNSKFDQAISFIFPFFQKINDIKSAIDKIDLEKILFIKYEDIVIGNAETIQNLENFLGFTINSEGVNENVKGKLDEASAFYSENYGKAITTNPIGGYKKILNSEQIRQIEHVFSYYMNSLKYG